MKQLISATLSQEAAEIYNEWPKQKKSKILSDIIIANDTIHKIAFARQKRIGALQQLLGRVIVRLYVIEGQTPLVDDINSELEETIYYQYFYQDTS